MLTTAFERIIFMKINIYCRVNNYFSIIRKSKRCKNFKRCVHITKTSSTNGIPPSKEK